MSVSCSHNYGLNWHMEWNIEDWPQPVNESSVRVNNDKTHCTHFAMSMTRKTSACIVLCSPKNSAHREVSCIINHHQIVSCYGEASDLPRHILRSQAHTIHREHVNWVTCLRKIDTTKSQDGLSYTKWDTQNNKQVSKLKVNEKTTCSKHGSE